MKNPFALPSPAGCNVKSAENLSKLTLNSTDTLKMFTVTLKKLTPALIADIEWNKDLSITGAPAGIWTRVTDSKGRYTWPDYTTGAPL